MLSLSRLNGEQRETLEIARVSGRGLVRLISTMCWTTRRSRRASSKSAWNPCRSHSCCARWSHCHRGVASAKNIVLTQSSDPRISPWLMADSLRVLQILENLVSNALKFTAEGSVEIWAELVQRAQGIDTGMPLREDTGIGIDAEAAAAAPSSPSNRRAPPPRGCMVAPASVFRSADDSRK